MNRATVALRLAVGLSLISAVLVCRAAPLSPPDAPQARTHKALLIGVDGLQYEKLQQAIEHKHRANDRQRAGLDHDFDRELGRPASRPFQQR